MLSVEHLTVAYGDVVAVDDLTLEVPSGETMAVLGPSGCGKSTLLRAIAGLERLRSGTVRVDGTEVTGMPPHRRGFALMFQDGQLFPHLTVAANVGYALKLRRRPRDERHRRVGELLDLVGLAGYGHRTPDELSGGEQQRVALARALAARPRLLLLDEPLSSLDRTLRERLAADLHDILAAERTSAILVTHDHDEAFAVAGRMAVMRAGRLVQAGTAEEVWRHPADPATARFLGYAAVVASDAVERLLSEPAPSAGAFALRRSALQVDDTGPLRGVVLSSRPTSDVTRLTVEVDGVGVLDAVAGLDAVPATGQAVRLRLDRSRTAFLPGEVRHGGDQHHSESAETGGTLPSARS